MDERTWRRALAVLPKVEGHIAGQLAVAFVGSDEFSAKSGSAWIWWPGSPLQSVQRHDYDGHYPANWGMLLVMSESALESLTAAGETCLSGLVRRGEIMPFLLQQRDALEAAGLIDFIETLELATPKH